MRKSSLLGFALSLLIAISVTAESSYDVSNRSGNQGGTSVGGQMSKPPDWLQGTFYSQNPRLALTIDANGRVTAESDGGSQSYGRYYEDRIYLDNEVYSPSRDRSGFRALNLNSRQTILFSRNRGDDGSDQNPNLDDLIGQRASSGELQLRNRGFRQVDSVKNRMSYTWWHQDRTKQCVMVVVNDERFADIVAVENRNCR